MTARLLSSFLTEMDGMELAHGVLVMGATNRPQALDAALVRQGGVHTVASASCNYAPSAPGLNSSQMP